MSLEGHKPYVDFISMSLKAKTFDTAELVKVSESHFRLFADFTPIDIYHNRFLQTLTINGSLAWFLNGHNLSFSKYEFQETIKMLSNKLDIKVLDAGIKQIEVSKLFKVVHSIEEYQNSHRELKGFERIMYQNTLYYNKYTRRGRRSLVLKMYDALANAKEKKMSVVPSSPSLKFEEKIYNVSNHFGRAISISELLHDDKIFQGIYEEMKHYYRSIEKKPKVLIANKPDSTDILLSALFKNSHDPPKEIELELKQSGLSIQEQSKRRVHLSKRISQLTTEDFTYHLNF